MTNPPQAAPAPAPQPAPAPKPAPPEAPVAEKGAALPEAVEVSVLGEARIDAVGLLPPSVTGFPHALWGAGKAEDVARAFADLNLERLPALQALLVTVLLAEAEPPRGSAPDGAMLLARIDKLLTIGALDQAQALLDSAGKIDNPDLFRRRFDVALLTDQSFRACEELRDNPGLSPALATRIFCLTRLGQIANASLTLTTARALDQVSPEEADLLGRFLDPDLAEEAGALPPPPRPVTPLVWRIYEAVGETLPTGGLPIAFAHAELDDRTAWRNRIEAAERLARAGVLDPNRLLGLYTERPPAASGGVWDRVSAFQALDIAIEAGDKAAIARALSPAYEAMKAAELEVPFATLYARPLSEAGLPASEARIAFELAVLSPDFERLASGPTGEERLDTAFLLGLAKGDVSGIEPPGSMARAIAPAFTDPALSPEFAALKEEGRVGEMILRAMARVMEGGFGDLRQITEGLSALRLAGLETVARRTALELMLLEMRG